MKKKTVLFFIVMCTLLTIGCNSKVGKKDYEILSVAWSYNEKHSKSLLYINFQNKQNEKFDEVRVDFYCKDIEGSDILFYSKEFFMGPNEIKYYEKDIFSQIESSIDLDADEGITFFIISDTNGERKYEKGLDYLDYWN